MKTNCRKRRGLTIVELLVVMAIIGILLSLLFPGLTTSRARARQTTCLSNLRQWGMAMMEYVDEQSDGIFPSEGTSVAAGGKVILNDPEAWFNVLPPLVNELPLKDRYATFPPNPIREGARSIFVCPAVNFGGLPSGFNPDQDPVFSYAYNLWIDHNKADRGDKYPNRLMIDHIKEPSRFVIFGEVAAFEYANMAGKHLAYRHGQGTLVNLCFADGHAASYRRHQVFVDPSQSTDFNRTVVWNPNATNHPALPE